MAVPDFQSMFRPFLQFAADGLEHRLPDAVEYVANYFNLSPADREELLPSGNQTRVANRVGWCRTHLKKAGLVEYTANGLFRITERGKDALKAASGPLTLKDLDKYPEHYTWFHTKKAAPSPRSNAITLEFADASAAVSSPEERMGLLAEELKGKLAADILDQFRTITPYRFERVVLDVLLAMGYGGTRKEAATVTQKSADEGIDGLINEDRLGLDRIYVQAKKWSDSVGRPHIQNFVGALAGQHASKGVFITTSEFTKGATDYAKTVQQRLVLIDGLRLAELMIEHNVGVARAYSYDVKRVDTDYFSEE